MGKDDKHPVIERGIALHKVIRLLTLAFGGEGWLSFMGNEFGHPEWLDFPREGNGWSYHYCRRQWSLLDNPDLKYHWLADFDRAMIGMARGRKLLEAIPARCLWIDHGRRVLCFERANLLFVFNFSVGGSYPDFEVPSPGGREWSLLLDSDAAAFGGHARIDPAITHVVGDDGKVRVYSPSRSAQVYRMADA
jgi:1,4-alpha-glucan branching enzyme